MSFVIFVQCSYIELKRLHCLCLAMWVVLSLSPTLTTIVFIFSTQAQLQPYLPQRSLASFTHSLIAQLTALALWVNRCRPHLNVKRTFLCILHLLLLNDPREFLKMHLRTMSTAPSAWSFYPQSYSTHRHNALLWLTISRRCIHPAP